MKSDIEQLFQNNPILVKVTEQQILYMRIYMHLMHNLPEFTESKISFQSKL